MSALFSGLAKRVADAFKNNVGAVVGSVAQLRAIDKAKYTQAVVTGYRAAGDGGAPGVVRLDPADTTTADNGGTVFVAADGGRWKRVSVGGITLKEWGCYGDGATDDLAFAQKAVDFACLTNGTVTDKLGLNFKLSASLTVTGNFRSIKFEGNGTGSAQTASSGGSCFVVTGNQTCITASFLTFANENIIVDGFNFYNTALDQVQGGAAIKIVRGATNGRYISGFVFRNVGIMGFGAAFVFQGLNVATIEDNYIGNVLMQNVSIQNTGIAFYVRNCVLNLWSMYNTLLLDCRYGGIRCENDGDVAPGTGKGSGLNASLYKCHFEGVGGMFRTQASAVTSSTGTVRSSISLYDFTHESCATQTYPAPAAGEPFALGANTDIHMFGYMVQGMPYGEKSLPYLNSTARIYSEAPISVFMAGGRNMSPKMVNAPIYRRTIANGASTTITVGIAETSGFAIRSTLILSDGQGGIIESLHQGADTGAPVRTAIAGAPAAGITLTWGTVAGAGAIQLRIDNASGYAYTAELRIENLSSASIVAASEI